MVNAVYTHAAQGLQSLERRRAPDARSNQDQRGRRRTFVKGASMTLQLNQVDKVEILTLQDNFIDVLAADSNAVIQRPAIFQQTDQKSGVIISASPMAEHGFSALVTVSTDSGSRSMLFDFGYSPHGAAFNADLIGADLSRVECLALSHGHMDHFGGIKELYERIGKETLEVVLHPGVFKAKRFLERPDGFKIHFPRLERNAFTDLGITIKEAMEPCHLLGQSALFLGQIPRKTEFETGMPGAFYEEDGAQKTDSIEDDTALAFHVRGKGLVVLSGCAHSGIVNTVNHAIETTGVEQVYVIMGGFHLSGPSNAPKVAPTIEALKAFAPEYVIPAHCTGREAVAAIEKAMPEEFILNMPLTRLTFSA